MSEPESGVERETITVHELLERSARAALDLQRDDGSFPPGRNGVYDESETPVRTTAKWLITLAKVYEYTGDEAFRSTANHTADYLLSDEARPHQYTFHSRRTEQKDQCDGLVGQAHPIRALAIGGQLLDRTDMLDIATDVFLQHPFHDRIGLWERVEIDGNTLSFDRTMNHQLLFAGAGSYLSHWSEDVAAKVRRFLNRLNRNLRIRKDGTIRHYVRPPLSATLRTVLSTPRHHELLRNELAHHVYSYSEQMRRKEIDYQPVNLLGLAWIKRNLPDHEFFTDETLEIPIKDLFCEDIRQRVLSEEHTFGSKLPGIVLAICHQQLLNNTCAEVQEWIQQDIRSAYDPSTGLFDAVETDPVGTAADICYLVDLIGMDVRLSV